MSADPGWPNGHFYSPVPSPDDIARAVAWRSVADPARIPGIGLDIPGMWDLAAELGRVVGSFRLREHPGQGRLYGWANEQFNAADAGVLTAMLARSRPRQVVEIGAGFSTACILDARDAFGLPTHVTTIDPVPERVIAQLGAGDRPGLEVIDRPVQDAGLERFLALGPGDVLFIDSSHVAKAGSDVLFEFFEILPRLGVGVLVHVHDVFPAFEYPPDWLASGRFWSELYLLRAYLIGNRDCRVDFWPGVLAASDKARFDAALPICNRVIGGSVWLRIVSSAASTSLASLPAFAEPSGPRSHG